MDRALVDAALEEFTEFGYSGMSMESIALRAGVSKVSLYRRWPSKLAVTADVLTRLSETTPVPDQGNLIADVRFLLTQSIGSTSARATAHVVFRTLGEMSVDPELLVLYRTHLLSRRIAQLRGLVERARERQELAPGLDTDVACALIAGPLLIYHLMLLTGSDIAPADLADQYAHAILDGIARRDPAAE
ncbi:MAG: TetR/AcrR family transcriptional regulator [Solirubrobacteraceae bacterium]